MKKIICICFAILLSVVLKDGNLSAQLSDPSKTYFNWTPPKVPKITHKDVRDYNIGEGRVFTGNIEYRDGVLSSYNGSFKDSSGNEYCGWFDSKLCVGNGASYIYIPASRDIAIRYINNNGTFQENSRWQLKGRSWYIYNCQVYYADGPSSSGGGYYNGGSSSDTGSSYNSHAALCRGCNGSGRCQHCKGSGWVNNNKSQCSLCHGSGTCVSCHGRGKVY